MYFSYKNWQRIKKSIRVLISPLHEKTKEQVKIAHITPLLPFSTIAVSDVTNNQATVLQFWES